MATYRLMDGLSGRPGNGPASPTAFAGAYQAGMIFGVSQGGMWFEGYWWWVPSGGDTGAQKFCLYSWDWYNAGGATTLISAATVTSGTLTAGAWNYIPLATPVQVSIGSGGPALGGMFIATTAWTAVNGFPDTAHQFGTGNPYQAGITNGPLFTFGQATQAGAGGTVFNSGSTTGVAGSDPAAVAPPTGTDGSFDNFWLDVQVSDTAPGSYSGTYRLWPNRGATGANFDTTQDASFNYVVATEIRLTVPCHIGRIWYYSPSGTAQLATRASVYSVTGPQSGTEVVAVTSPSWSGAAGSGWVHTAVPGIPVLPAGTYKVAVYNSAGAPDGWSAKDAGSAYWTTGEGAAGITSGPLYAPRQSLGSPAYFYDQFGGSNSPPYSDGTGRTEGGQCTFAQTGPQYPYLYVDGLAQNYWVDLEVTPDPPAAVQARSPARPPAVAVSMAGWRGGGHSR